MTSWARRVLFENLESRLNLSTGLGGSLDSLGAMLARRLLSGNLTTPAPAVVVSPPPASKPVPAIVVKTTPAPAPVTVAFGTQSLRAALTNLLRSSTPAAAPVAAAPPPPPPVTNGGPVAISQVNEGILTRLVITGTTGNDSIVVTQSGNTLTVTANGNVNAVTGNFGELAIYGVAGNDAITVQASVTVRTFLYGGTGSSVLTAAGSGQNFIVTVGSSGGNTLRGNGVDTAFWGTTTDTINASAAEIANGGVHRVSGFLGGVSTQLAGQNLADPTDSGAEVTLSGRSLFGNGPAIGDVNQGQVGDCYFLASLDAFAAALPGRLQEMAVDLGDGTYAVQFMRGGVATYVRVDAELPVDAAGGLVFNQPAADGAIWGSIVEKAYAFFRGGGTYAGLLGGWMGDVYNDLGVANTSFSTIGDATTLFHTITGALAGNNAVTIMSNPIVAAEAPVIGSHVYTVLSASTDANGEMWVTLRNPWGVSGPGTDPMVTVTVGQLQAYFAGGTVSL